MRRGRQEVTLLSVLFCYEYFKILLLYFKKYIDFDFKNLRLEKNEKIGCMLHCYKIEFNFLQRSLANIYYITSSLRVLILWNKMYQESCCYSPLKDVTTLRRKRRVIILSTAAPELEFYNGRRSFLAMKFTLVTAISAHTCFDWLRRASFELLTNVNIENDDKKSY